MDERLDVRGEKYSSPLQSRLCCDQAHQAVICVCLASADHIWAPEQVHRECVHAGLVIHNGHIYTLQALIRLICFEEE